jgi:hypothetical protein
METVRGVLAAGHRALLLDALLRVQVEEQPHVSAQHAAPLHLLLADARVCMQLLDLATALALARLGVTRRCVL